MTKNIATIPATVQGCYDIIIEMDPQDEENRTDLIKRLASLRRNCLGFLKKAQRGTHGGTMVLRIWTEHTDAQVAQRDLSSLSRLLRALYTERQLTVWVGDQMKMCRFSSFDEATRVKQVPFDL